MLKLNKNQILVGVAVLAILVTGALVLSKSGAKDVNVLSFFGTSNQKVAEKTLAYINANMLPAGQIATLDGVSEASGLVKMKVKIGATSYDTYVTKDGKLLFPVNAVETSVTTNTNTAAPTTQVTPATVKKVATTSLDAYIVSGCPYGLQIQRAIGGAVKAVPSLADSIKIRYIGGISGNTITAMHGTEEADENLRQICIRDEQRSKYWAYVDCYMKKATGTAANGMPYGDTKTCQATANIDTAKLNACVTTPSRGVAYAKEDFDLGTKLGVTGSPTMVLNGEKIDETPFGGRSADAMRNIICSSSSSAPGFCAKTLDTTPASTSFSLTYASPAGATASANTNCAPAVQ